MDRPNILFVVADDMGPWAFGAAGDPDARTPNLDRLCREGMRMTNYFCSSPVCSAARSCLITGRYSTETGIRDYINPKETESDVGLEPEFATWPRCLEDAGYATALVGKWHLGSLPRHQPTRHGYQEFFGELTRTSRDPELTIGNESRTVQGYTPDVTADFAIDVIQRFHRRKASPFMLSVHFFGPHANNANRSPEKDRTWLPLCDEDWDLFKDLDPEVPNPDYPNLDIPRLKQFRREYLASVHSVDRNVGRIISELERLEIADETLIVFTSDNGYNLGHNGIWHKGNGWWILTDNQGNRPNIYDNSLRVLLIVRWPSVVPAGSIRGETASHLDWFPTLAEIGGASVAESTVMRGKSILPLLQGDQTEWDNDLFAQYAMWDWNQNGSKLRSFRTPEWKLIQDFRNQGVDELYDLREDPAENQNLIDSPDPAVQQVRDQLNERMLGCMREIDDPELAA